MCTPLSLTLAIITPENDKQISFGLTHTCNDDGSDSWEIDFTFKEKVSGNWVTIIDLKLNVNPQAQKAQTTAANGLTSNQLLFLQGPVYKKAKQVANQQSSSPAVAQFVQTLKADKITSLTLNDLGPIETHANELAAKNDQLNALVIATLSVQ
jgi:hypothetical protein